MKALTIVASALLFIATLFLIISLATTSWITYSTSHSGLLRSCATVGDTYVCSSLPSDTSPCPDGYKYAACHYPSMFKATFAMIFIGMVAIFAAFVCCALKFFMEKPVLGLVVLIGCGVGTLFWLIGMIVFGCARSAFIGDSLGYSCVLAIVAGILACIGSVVSKF